MREEPIVLLLGPVALFLCTGKIDGVEGVVNKRGVGVMENQNGKIIIYGIFCSYPQHEFGSKI